MEMQKDAIKTEWEKPKCNPLDDLSNEQISKILEFRSKVLMDIQVAYNALIEAIYKQPFHVIYRQHAFLNIDQGLHWCKTAVDNIWELPKVDAVAPIASVEEANAPMAPASCGN